MRGLRKQENPKFEKFIELVQKKASETDCVFFLDCGEGRDFETETMEGEDLSGWLIPNHLVEKFENQFDADQIDSSQWDSCVVFVLWNETKNVISVEFNEF